MLGIKRIRVGRAPVVHIETDLGIVNIHLGLHDRFGRKVEAIQVIPNNYAGELKVKRIGDRLVQMKRQTQRRSR